MNVEEHSLRTLLHGMVRVPGRMDRPVNGLAVDSRQVREGDLFLARAGYQVHGGEFVDDAIEQGAVAVVAEIEGDAPRQVLRQGVPVFGVPGLGQRLGEIAARFYGDPSQRLTVIGVTGTNGKTTVTHLLAHALDAEEGVRCGVIGTLGYGLVGALEPAPHTTPEPVLLQATLAQLLQRGATHVAMEVSSHALAQFRVEGVGFDVAVFTNLSHDHLDFHGDLANYGRAKRSLFVRPSLRHAVINSDDEVGRKWLESPPGMARAWSYGLDPLPSGKAPAVYAETFEPAGDGLRMEVRTPWGKGRLHSPLLGRFNGSNLLAALTVLGVLDIPLDRALEHLGRARPVAGRMEVVRAAANRPLVVVDYAHTPDALEQALKALRSHTSGRLWCVFGCGGERDQAKRRAMGDIAERLADHVVVTWDNPRGEEPGTIVGQILGGMEHPQQARVERDRGQAIAYAITHAGADDAVLIAGKGHEEVQIIGDRRLAFSDRGVARRILNFEF